MPTEILLVSQLVSNPATLTALRRRGVFYGCRQGDEYLVLLEEDGKDHFLQGSGSDLSKWRRVN